MIARGRVTKSGRNISICHGDVYAISDNQEKLIVTMLSTMMAIRK
jgi:acyl-coenzyme A thioesterase PaaI-like protein